MGCFSTAQKLYFTKVKQIGNRNNVSHSYLIRSKDGKDEYAYKIIKINSNNTKEEEKEKKKILNEFEFLKKINHPNVILLINAYYSENKKYLYEITEYADGGDLQMKLSEHIKKKEFFDENTLIDWFMQTCLALLYIHSKNILHRDIRPSNIFLMKQNYVKLGYFGVAKSLTPGLKYTKTRVSMPQYSAPEILNNQEYTNKADIWSLGVTFYQLITLNYPFEGTTEEEKEKNIKDGKKIEKPKECPFDQQFIEIIDKMLSIKDDERPSAEEILDKAIIKNRMQAYLIEKGFDSLKAFQSITEYEEKEDKKTNINNNIYVIEDENEDEFDKDLIDIFNDDMVNKNEEKRNKKANYDLNRQMTLMSKHIKKANTFPSRSSKINI